MAAAPAAPGSPEPSQLGLAIVSFALDSRFPEREEISSQCLSAADLQSASEALAKAKADLEAEIRVIDDETRDDVAAWVQMAGAIQEDIVRSKAMASDIMRQSEAPAASGQEIRDAEARVEFVAREAQYSDQLCWALECIRDANELLNQVERATRDDRRPVDSLRLLEQSRAAMDRIPVSKTCRIIRLLDVRSFELRSDVHDVFDRVWKSLVRVDVDDSRVTISSSSAQEGEDEQLRLDEVVIGLKAYKEVDERMEQLWHNMDGTILSPRMQRAGLDLKGIKADGDTIQLTTGESSSGIESLLDDLETFCIFLSRHLPADLLASLCSTMMPDLVSRLVHVWLDAEVPPSLMEMDRFQDVIGSAGRFAATLETNGLTHMDALREWVGSAPSVWLNKCRDTALSGIRTKLSAGITGSRQVERVERRMIFESDVRDPAATDRQLDMPEPSSGTKTGGDDHQDAAAVAWEWDDDGGEGGEGDEGSHDGTVRTELDKSDREPGLRPEQTPGKGQDKPRPEERSKQEESGWDFDYDDDDPIPDDQPPPPPPPPENKKTRQPVESELRIKPGRRRAETPTTGESGREVVLREWYMISSMPEPVLSLILAILEDGAALTREGSAPNPVATAAPGLFGLPTSALALFRAVSPHYYSKDVGGNMYLYNDASYLADRLAEFGSDWLTRDDLSSRARSMLQLGSEVKSLRGFANRTYSNEVALQKTILRDLLGGARSLMQQQQDEVEASVESATGRVLAVAAVWEPILARSTWAQAVGSLVDAVSAKLIADVTDMAAIGQDEAYRIAGLISRITELDALFLPSRLAGAAAYTAATPSLMPTQKEEEGEVPQTAQYAPSWLRLKYLSEVLQANLADVRFLWFESELSLWFSAEEVVDLIGLSFAPNERVRAIVREIRARPHPLK